MKSAVVVIGIGEMGSVFARGFLRNGHPVYPITRNEDIATAAITIPEPELVLVAVAEGDLHPILEQIPQPWHNKLALLQNELLPCDWQQHPFEKPTVISVWFEKKKGQDSKVIIPSPVFGPHAKLINDGLNSIDIACNVLNNDDELLYELVRKNVYILTSNIAGIVTGGNVGELWADHRKFASTVADEIIDIQAHLTGKSLPRTKLIDGMVEAFDGDKTHKCMGRSAPARLARTLTLAARAGINTPQLKEIAAKQG
ncbi:MAG: 2-dehydropantoate 2-reductase [Gammaproteobacteria bacterium]|nr:2-dehydropantoate 2-reductase [Gammaproteobacteria bacterium]